jgi:hypothetical protein
MELEMSTLPWPTHQKRADIKKQSSVAKGPLSVVLVAELSVYPPVPLRAHWESRQCSGRNVPL